MFPQKITQNVFMVQPATTKIQKAQSHNCTIALGKKKNFQVSFQKERKKKKDTVLTHFK